MPGSDGLRILGDFEKKKAVSWDSGLGESSCRLWDASRVVESDGTVSIVKIVSLSPRVEKPKSQEEGNKSFVPEQRKSSVFRDSYAYERSTYPYI